MNTSPLSRMLAALAVSIAATFSVAVSAQTYPDRPIKILLPAPPGGGIDGVARQLSEPLAIALKQPVVLDNRPGAGGVIASQALARSAPDGYTLLLVQSAHAINPSSVKNLPYDTLKDFTSVAKLGESPLVLVAAAQTGVQNMADFIAFARRNPDKFSFGTTEISSRLASEQLAQAAGVKGLMVNYKGLAQALTDVVGGSLSFLVTTISATLPFKDAGKFNFVGLTAPKRSAYLPNVPTLAEQGYNIDIQTWYGLLAPGGTPPAILERLSREVAQIGKQPEFEARLRALSIQPSIAGPREMDALIKSEIVRWGELIRAAGIQPE
jgi:tripartite-type tricarboxylate transporter receptor subunit TctC